VDFDRLQPALADLSAEFEEDLVGYLRAITRFALNEVPRCVGISITIIDDQGIPFTVTATDPYVRTLDGTQYLDDGPCLDSIRHGAPIAVDDVLDESRWHAYAESAAARGIRSSLSLPLLFDGSTIGALNLYGSSPEAFNDRAHLLAELISGHAALAITNADLSLQMADRAAVTQAERTAEPDPRIEQAIQVLARHRQISSDEARHQLHSAAGRAGIRPAQLGEAIMVLHGTQ
jgi:GAF domain-containing protein